MASTLGVDHGGGRVAAHARRTHEMPAPRAQQLVRRDVAGARRLQHVTGPRDPVIQHAAAVLAEPVGHARSGNAVAVGELGVEIDAIVRLGQVLAMTATVIVRSNRSVYARRCSRPQGTRSPTDPPLADAIGESPRATWNE